MSILVHRKMIVLYVWLVSSKYINILQSYGKSPITSGSPLALLKNPIEITRKKTMISYTKYYQTIYKLFILEDSSRFSNDPQTSFDRAEIIQEKTRIFQLLLDCSMIEYLEFSNDY